MVAILALAIGGVRGLLDETSPWPEQVSPSQGSVPSESLQADRVTRAAKVTAASIGSAFMEMVSPSLVGAMVARPGGDTDTGTNRDDHRPTPTHGWTQTTD